MGIELIGLVGPDSVAEGFQVLDVGYAVQNSVSDGLSVLSCKINLGGFCHGSPLICVVVVPRGPSEPLQLIIYSLQ